MSTGQDRIYGNSFPNPRDQYNPDLYYNQPPQQFYPNNFERNYYQPSTETYIDHSADHIGNFTPFYIAITICTIIGFALFVINIALGCCSNYSEYWKDRHTGMFYFFLLVHRQNVKFIQTLII